MSGKRMAVAALAILMTMGQLTGCAGNTEQEVEEISEQENVEMEVSDFIEEETILSEETIQDTVDAKNEEISNKNSSSSSSSNSSSSSSSSTEEEYDPWDFSDVDPDLIPELDLNDVPVGRME